MRTLPIPRAAVAALAVAVAACSSKPAPGAAPAAAPTATAAPAAAQAFVSVATALRREPSEAARVPGPGGGKEVANALTVLQRGERVTIVEAREEWAKVRSSDDRDGWLKRTTLVEGEGVAEATVLAAADVFDRPDLLAANARRKIEPGTLLLVVKSKPPFSEVNVSSGPNAWVLSERLSTAEREVSVAKLVEKARWLLRNGKGDEAKQMLALAREHFAGCSLIDTLATELGEPPPSPAPGAVLPASAPAPATPAPPPAPGGSGG